MKQDDFTKVNLAKIKMIVCDVDGTLLNDQNVLTEFTINTFREFSKRYPRIHLVLATGRAYESTYKLAKELFYHESFLIINNGAVLTTDTKFAPLKEFKMDRGKVERILQYTQKRLITTVLFVGASKKLISHNMKLSSSLPDFCNWPFPFRISEQDLNCTHHVYQISAWVTHNQIQKFLAFIKFELQLQIYYYNHDNFSYFEITEQHVNKWSMIEFLLQKWDLTTENVLAFGNGNNDAIMLKKARYGICVQKSDPEAVAAADMMIGSNNHNAVAQFMRDFWLKK